MIKVCCLTFKMDERSSADSSLCCALLVPRSCRKLCKSGSVCVTVSVCTATSAVNVERFALRSESPAIDPDRYSLSTL
jgi:hypothetical protein